MANRWRKVDHRNNWMVDTYSLNGRPLVDGEQVEVKGKDGEPRPATVRLFPRGVSVYDHGHTYPATTHDLHIEDAETGAAWVADWPLLRRRGGEG